MTNRILRLILPVAAIGALAFAGIAAAGSTNVGLISFSVSKPTKATKKKPRIVTVRWRTATEPDTLGFNLYRGTRVRVKLNRAVIPSRGRVAGASYKWLDRLPRAVKGFPCYRLESVSARGARTLLKQACSGKQVSPATKPANTAVPVISGSATVGSTLSAANGTWTGSPSPTYTYQWRRCDSTGANCTSISGATSGSYTVVAADAGSTLRVNVTARNSAGSATATSNATAVVTSGVPVNTSAPSISGSATVGSTLTTTNGTWAGDPSLTYTYQWTRCDATGASCTAIAGATSQTYTVVAADAGFTIRVDVTATNSAGSATATSNATAVVT